MKQKCDTEEEIINKLAQTRNCIMQSHPSKKICQNTKHKVNKCN